MIIIPAIDIIEGKCVRLEQGDYARRTEYSGDPLNVAMEFQDAGLKRLHLVDLDGARLGTIKNWKVLERIAGKTSLDIDFGGGIKQQTDVDIVFNSGAAYASVGSIAVKNEKEFVNWISIYGADKFMLGADVRNEKIAINGWLENTDIWVRDLIEKYLKKGITQVFCTDISVDGKLEGPSLGLYRELIREFSQLFLIASGGVSSMKDVEELENIGCSGVIIGKAIYEKRILLSELKSYVD